jgi:hypothetical protein
MLSAYNSLPQGVTRLVNSFVSKTEPTAYLVAKIEQLLASNSPSADPVWMLGAAVAATALVGFFVQKVALRRRQSHHEPALALPNTA